MKTPVRLAKREEPKPMSLILLHPAVLLIAGLILIIICSALIFAVTGHSTVESGSMRNFIATGV